MKTKPKVDRNAVVRGQIDFALKMIRSDHVWGNRYRLGPLGADDLKDAAHALEDAKKNLPS